MHYPCTINGHEGTVTFSGSKTLSFEYMVPGRTLCAYRELQDRELFELLADMGAAGKRLEITNLDMELVESETDIVCGHVEAPAVDAYDRMVMEAMSNKDVAFELMDALS